MSTAKNKPFFQHVEDYQEKSHNDEWVEPDSEEPDTIVLSDRAPSDANDDPILIEIE